MHSLQPKLNYVLILNQLFVITIKYVFVDSISSVLNVNVVLNRSEYDEVRMVEEKDN